MDDLFQRLKKHTEFTDAQDYIFADPETGEMLNKKIYYRHWDEIVRNTQNLPSTVSVTPMRRSDS